jgi:holliday junction DNA helicase RuvA
MIATLQGIVSEKSVQGMIIDVNGVGYNVLATAGDLGKVSSGQKVKVYIHEHIKEDAHDLYGFSSPDIKKLFEQLLSVKNVGPKVGLAVLDIGSADSVRLAIANGEVKQLQTAKGVGKRAAEQIVVELRDKVGAVVGDGADEIINRSGLDKNDEAMMALVSLGFSENDALVALQGIDKELSSEERIKQALKAGK